MSDSDSGPVRSEEPGFGKRLHRLWIRFLCWTIPYYETRSNNPEVFRAAYRRAERRGRLPEDPD